MKKAAYGFAGLIVLFVGAALVVPSVIDWNAYKAEIAAEVRKATGRTLDIGGEIEFAVLPTPRLRVTDARLSNAPGAAVPHMVSFKELEVSVKLGPLFHGDIEVAGVELLGSVIELEKLADGKMNWSFTPEVQNDTSPSKAIPNGKSQPSAFKLDRLRIENGTIVYRDKSAGTIERIDNLTADISAASLAGPFAFDGALTVRNTPLILSARVNKFAEKGAVPFHVNIGAPGTEASIGLNGTVTDIETAPSVSARLTGKGGNLGAMIHAIVGVDVPHQLSQAFSASASIKGSDTSVSVDQLSFQLGESTVTGNANVSLKEGVKADIALQMKSLDIDALSMGKGVTPARKVQADTGNAAGNPTSKAPAVAASGFAIPGDIEANLELSVEEVVVKKGRVRGVRLAASLKDAAVTLNTLEAVFPGSGQLSLTGTLKASKNAPAYDGRIAFRAASLRDFLNWLEIDIAGVPADRLRRFSLNADVSGNASQIQIANMGGQLDASRMSGGVTVALRDRIAFGASFSIDQLNADAYIGKAGQAAAVKAVAPATGAVTPDKRTSNAEKNRFAALNDFDANLTLRVGSLGYRQAAIQDVRFDGTLVNGKLTLSDASVRNFAGMSARLAGVVSDLSERPAFSGTVAAASDNLTGLFGVAGIKSSIEPRKLGKMRLSSRVDMAGGKLKLNADLQIAEVRAQISGNAINIHDAPDFELAVDAKHPELARLSALLRDSKAGPGSGRVGLNLNLKGNEKSVAATVSSSVAGGTFRLSGNVGTPLEIPKFDLAFDLKHPDLVGFVRSFNPAFRPSNPKLGGLELAAKLAGTEKNLAIGDLTGRIGPTRISGAGSYQDGLKRPIVNLSLRSSLVPLNDFLKAPPVKRGSAARTGSAGSGPGAQRDAAPQRWSTDPIDIDSFGIADANIDLRAEALLYHTFQVDQPKIIAVLKDKVLDIQRVSGTMFDGGFEMKGKVDGRSVPIAATNLTITKANVGKALFQAAEFDIATGVLSFGMNLSAHGRSQRDMIRSLNGNGRIDVVDGAVKGFDLKRVSDNLKNLNQLTGLLGVLSSAMGGGVTRFSSLKGTFGIERGIMRTDDLKLIADAGEGEARGFANLPEWNMDMVADFRLTEHPDAPPFRVRAVGPPDDPRRLFDFQALQAWVLQQGVGGLIRNLVPGAKDGSGSQQQQNQQVKPEDILRGLFKGLGR